MILDPKNQDQTNDQSEEAVNDTESTGSAGGLATEETGSDQSSTSDMDKVDYSEE